MNNTTISFDGEDHTLGNLLRSELLQNEDVIFAGYTVPHPLTRRVVIRIQTIEKSCEEAIKTSITSIINKLDDFEKAFEQAL